MINADRLRLWLNVQEAAERIKAAPGFMEPDVVIEVGTVTDNRRSATTRRSA